MQHCSVLSVKVEMYANHNDKSGGGEGIGHGFPCLDTLSLILNRAAVVGLLRQQLAGIVDLWKERHIF